MGLLDRVKGLFGVSFGGAGAGTYISAQEWALGLPVSDPSGIQYPYAQHPTVAICIRTISEDAAGVCWELYPAQGDEDDDQIEEHPLLELWERPNEMMAGSDLWVSSYTYFKLTGECIWYYPGLRVGVTNGVRANRRNTGTLAVLDPTSVIVTAKEGRVEYKQRVNGIDYPLDLKYLTHFKRFNPYNPYRGLSELDSLAMEMNVDWNAASWNQAFFGDQNGIPTGVLKPAVGSVLPSDQRDDYLKQWNSRHSKKRGIGLLPPGWEWESVGGAPKDMEFSAMREFSREQILAVFGVPPFMAGVLDKANYANAREQRSIYWNGTVSRMLSYFQGVINHDFMPKVGVTDIEAYPDFESVKALTEDLETKSRIGQTLFGLGFTKRMINDRVDLGLQVDDLVDADVGYLPISFIPVDMVEEAHTPVAPAAPAEGEDKPAADEKKFYRREAKPRHTSRRENVWRSVVAQTRDIEARFERVIRKHFREIEAEVLQVMHGLKGWSLAQGVIKADQSSLFDIQHAKSKLLRLTLPLHAAAVDRGGTAVMSEIGAEASFDKLSPNVSAKLAELSRKILGIDDTVEKRLRESLVDGLTSGEGVPELTKRIEHVMDASATRASTIARTETGNAFTAGRVEGMRQGGVSKQEWLTAHDEFVRESHARLDGEVRALDEAFGNGLRYPCDNNGAPEESINCFVPGTLMSGLMVAGSRFKYVGPVIEITTSAGDRLTVTPNHPVLTPKGFAPARSLREGDDLLSKRPKGELVGLRDDDDHAPSAIEEIFHALEARSGGASRQVIALEQFHGDALFGEGDVEVVVPDGELLFDVQPNDPQMGGEGVLGGAPVGQTYVPSGSPSDAPGHRIDGAASSLPGCATLTRDLVGVGLHCLPFQGLRIGSAPDWDSILTEEAIDGVARGAGIARELLHALAGQVTTDQVVGVRELEFSGHVYDLQSANGLLVAANIITSNCRCTVVPVIGE